MTTPTAIPALAPEESPFEVVATGAVVEVVAFCAEVDVDGELRVDVGEVLSGVFLDVELVVGAVVGATAVGEDIVV